MLNAALSIAAALSAAAAGHTTEIQRHARDSALQLAEQRGCGKVVSEQVMRRLLDGGSDAPLQGLMTILLTSPDRHRGFA